MNLEDVNDTFGDQDPGSGRVSKEAGKMSKSTHPLKLTTSVKVAAAELAKLHGVSLRVA
jgi:hypothetical protein